MDNRTQLELYRELIGLADSLDGHVTAQDAAAKLRELAESLDHQTISIPDEKINAMAQYLYEGINISPDVRLVMDMTAKATLVRVLRAAMSRAHILNGRNEWTVAMLHLPDCSKCEECVDLAVSSAMATGSQGGSWQMEERMPDGQHSIMHRAVVERKA